MAPPQMAPTLPHLADQRGSTVAKTVETYPNTKTLIAPGSMADKPSSPRRPPRSGAPSAGPIIMRLMSTG